MLNTLIWKCALSKNKIDRQKAALQLLSLTKKMEEESLRKDREIELVSKTLVSLLKEVKELKNKIEGEK